MIFESKRLQRLSGVLNESMEVKEAETCERDAYESDTYEANQEDLKELDMGGALVKTGTVAYELFQALKKDENKALRDSLREIIPEKYQSSYDKALGVKAGAPPVPKGIGKTITPKTESIEEEEVRAQVREEIRSLWSSGQIFNKSNSRKGNVTVGFPGIGFRR